VLLLGDTGVIDFMLLSQSSFSLTAFKDLICLLLQYFAIGLRPHVLLQRFLTANIRDVVQGSLSFQLALLVGGVSSGHDALMAGSGCGVSHLLAGLLAIQVHIGEVESLPLILPSLVPSRLQLYWLGILTIRTDFIDSFLW